MLCGKGRGRTQDLGYQSRALWPLHYTAGRDEAQMQRHRGAKKMQRRWLRSADFAALTSLYVDYLFLLLINNYSLAALHINLYFYIRNVSNYKIINFKIRPIGITILICKHHFILSYFMYYFVTFILWNYIGKKYSSAAAALHINFVLHHNYKVKINYKIFDY